MLLRRETVQLSRLKRLKDFCEASAVGVVQPLDGGPDEAKSTLDVKLRRLKERIRILERCLQNNGVLTGLELNK